MSRIAEKIIQLVTDATVRGLVNKEAERLLPKTGARCAMTASLYAKRAGAIDKLYPDTIGLQRALEKKGAVRINDYRHLEPGDYCFAQDLKPVNDKPDHVYIFVAYDGPKTALIVDNQQDETGNHLHNRNLLTGSKTPFAFALRLRDENTALLAPETARVHFAYFAGLEQQGLLSQETAKRLHDFRNSPEFKAL